MKTEQELKNNSPLQKEFQNLLDKDFKDRKLKENEIIKATVTEITKNFVVVDCKAKMEGMIPVEEFKNEIQNIEKFRMHHRYKRACTPTLKAKIQEGARSKKATIMLVQNVHGA